MRLSNIPGHIFKYIEGELYDLKNNKNNLEELKEDIAVKGMGLSYEGVPGGSNDFYSKTENSAEKIMSNKVAIRAGKTITCIEKALKELNDPEFELYFKKYRQGKGWKKILSEMNISQATYFRWRRKIVRKVGQELGLIEKD